MVGFQQDYKCFQSHAAGISENLTSISLTVVSLAIGNLASFESNLTHCWKVQKYEQGKIGLQFFDMWS